MQRRRQFYNKTIPKPAHALTRADDLLALGEKGQAFEVLSSVASRRNRVWEKDLETVVIKFLDLSVEIGKGNRAKDVLHQYRNCASQHPQSLELVLNHFIRVSEAATDIAQAKADKIIAETSQTVEQSLLIGESVRDRVERELVSPWLRFLWDAYRTVLEVVRTNNRLESLYKDTVIHALDYCVKYERTHELRRLADLLRTHFSNVIKTNPQYFDAQDRVLFQLEIRFAQLQAAIKLAQWQEAYKTVDDIKNNIIIHAESAVPDQMLIDYYQHVATLFWVSKNYFFHAIAVRKLIALKLNQITEAPQGNDLLSSGNSRILLAALCAPIVEEPSNEFSLGFDIQREKASRLARLVDYEGDYTRTKLFELLLQENTISKTFPEVHAVYELFEKSFKPLHFSNELTKSLDFVLSDDELSMYAPRLRVIGFQKLIRQLARMYSTIEISQLEKISSPIITSRVDLEKALVTSLADHVVYGSIDHLKGIVTFDTPALDSEDMRFKLAEITRTLRTCVKLLETGKTDQAALDKKAAMKKKLLQAAAAERASFADRRALIERLKVLREEKELLAAKAAEAKAKEDEEMQQKLEEKRRAEKLAKRQEKEAKMAKVESDKKKAEIMAKKLQEMAEQTGGKKVARADIIKEVQQKDQIDAETFVKEQVQKLYQERQRAEQAILTAATRFDHQVRARRELEAPAVRQAAKDKAKAFEDANAAAVKERAERREKERQAREDSLKRLTRMADTRAEFEKDRRAKHEDRNRGILADYEQQVKTWREKRRQELIREIEEREKAEAARRQKREEEKARLQQEARDAAARTVAEPAPAGAWRTLPSSSAAASPQISAEASKAWRPSPSGAPAAAAAEGRPWRSPAGGQPVEGESKPWRTPGGQPAEGESKPWRSPAGGQPAESPAESRPAESRPWRSPAVRGGEDGSAGEERPSGAWRSTGRGGAGREREAPEGSWRRPGGDRGAPAPSSGAGESAERPWRKTGGREESSEDSRPWKRTGGGEDRAPAAEASRPWRPAGRGERK